MSAPDSAKTPGANRRYRTIVADPPWPYNEKLTLSWRKGRPSGEGKPFLSYPTMPLDEIAALPMAVLADQEAHLFVWTTQRYLVWTQAQVATWGFQYRKLLVWAKPPTGFSLGATFGNSCEFIVYATRGKPERHGKVSRDWWEWSRAGHSVKPEAFLDVVECVCPGPYLELFARRQRLGWDTWGNEALNHVDVAV